MTSVVIDAATREKLLATGGVGEVRDEGGNLIGRVVLADVPPTPPPGYVIVGEWPTSAELARREREGKWHSVAEVEAFIRGLKRATRCQ